MSYLNFNYPILFKFLYLNYWYYEGEIKNHMNKYIITSFLILFTFKIYSQKEGIILLPEAGPSYPIGDFKSGKAFANHGLQFGLNIEKMWGKIGIGLYGGYDKNDINFVDLLPADNPGLSIIKSRDITQYNWKQYIAGIGPVLKFDISRKFSLDISSKIGFAKLSYPDFRQYVNIGSPLNEIYTLYQTNNEDVEKKLNLMLLSALRLNYKLSKRIGLSLSINYKNVRDVLHSYSYLNGDFNPDMSNEALIKTLQTAPTITEIRKCHFNSIGLTLGVSFNFSCDKENHTGDNGTNPENTKRDSCLSSLIRNGEFAQSNNRASSISYWTRGYGNPNFLNTPGEGCFDPGYVEASGNQSAGDAVSQTLHSQNKIRMGKKYMLSVGVRFFNVPGALDYVRIRAIAYNGALPLNGNHPNPGTNIAIIGRSGKIRDCGDWSVIEFPVWIANKDFQNIAINVFTNDGTSSKIWIDDVSLCETNFDIDCDELQLNSQGEPVIPAGYGSVPTGFTCIPEEEEDEYNNGSLQDLYGQLYGYDGTTNWYSQAMDKCFSVGGTIPDEVKNYNCDDSLKMEGINMTCDELQRLLDNPDLGSVLSTKPPPLPSIGPLQDTCKSILPDGFDQMAFKGKDIIYIHGLQLSHLCARASFKQGADANWPLDQYEFYSGYYKGVAVDNWKPHIDYFLRGKGNKNRYLIVTYNCSQRADIAVHAVLSQIREAMENGTGVEFDPSDPREKECFARDYIIVSTSTGSLVGDIALSIANKTKTDLNLKAIYGNIGLISDRCKGHMAVRGAMSGSNLATILISSQVPTLLAQKATLGLTDGQYQTNFSAGPNKNLILGSILYDLVPQVTRAKWSNFINTVSVPVVTISSGHPKSMLIPFFFKLHPGFDDGVLSMDCSSGRINPSSSLPSQYIPTSALKVFDMGIPLLRASCYFLDQRMPSGGFAVASTPYLSLTGMVQPVASVIPMPRFNNHFTFVQSPAEHLLPQKSSYFDCNYWPTQGPNGPSNYEEVLVVSNSYFYFFGIVNSSIIYQMGESVRDRHIYYPMIKIKMRHGIPLPTIYLKKFYIWKRTYHTLNDNCMYDCDYGYKYLFKN